MGQIPTTSPCKTDLNASNRSLGRFVNDFSKLGGGVKITSAFTCFPPKLFKS